jgi:hypothetical protein
MSTIDEDEMPQAHREVFDALTTFPMNTKGVRRINVRIAAGIAGISPTYAHQIIHQLDAVNSIRIVSAPGRRLRIKIPQK